MGFWYNKKDDEKVANLSCTNWSEANSKFEFTELGFTSDDTFYLIAANATAFSDCQKMGEKDFKLTEQLIKFKVARKNYVKKDWKTKEDVSVEQSRVEKWLCKILDDLDSGKRYKGFLHMQDGNFMNHFLTGKDVTGQEIPPETLAWMGTNYFQLEEVDENLITSESLVIPANKSSGGYSRGQSEKEKLTDKLNFVNELIQATFGLDKEEGNVRYLMNGLSEKDDLVIQFMKVLEAIM